MDRDVLTEKVIGCAIEVHKHLGPGLLESSYECCLLRELQLAGIDAQGQVSLPVSYKGWDLEVGYRLDILIPSRLIIELKTVDKLAPYSYGSAINLFKALWNKNRIINQF